MQGKNLLLSLFLGGFGIDRMVNGCYIQGFVKGTLWMVPVIGLPLQGAWWITDVGKAAFGSDGYFYCSSKKLTQKSAKKTAKKTAPSAPPWRGAFYQGGQKTRKRRT